MNNLFEKNHPNFLLCIQDRKPKGIRLVKCLKHFQNNLKFNSRASYLKKCKIFTMNLITRHTYRTIEKFVEDTSINYITYHKNTQHIQVFTNVDLSLYVDTYGNILCNQDKVLIFNRELYESNIKTTIEIKQAIKESSFSCKDALKKHLIYYFIEHKHYDFVQHKDTILQEIQKRISNNSAKQSLKLYNNILKRLKYCCLELFEQTEEQRVENLKNSIIQRDTKIRQNKEKIAKEQAFVEKINASHTFELSL